MSCAEDAILRPRLKLAICPWHVDERIMLAMLPIFVPHCRAGLRTGSEYRTSGRNLVSLPVKNARGLLIARPSTVEGAGNRDNT